jgi:serine/threonine protein kinase
MAAEPSQPTRPGTDTSIDSFVRAVGRAPEIPLEAMRDELAIGEVLAGQFRIDREIGRGGMGVVFQARDTQLDRDVAIKVMRADRWPLDARPRLAAIFEREAKATARLNHPGIVTLYGAGKDDGALYLVLELLRGQSLVRTLERGPAGAREALRITREVVQALAHAHAQGILHRDLKPQNVFVTDDGRIKLLDFGLASLDVALSEDASAVAMSRAGTPAYMAPEQWSGAPQDARTDVWAAGVLLYQLLRGALPFAPKSGEELERALPVSAPADGDRDAYAIALRAMAWKPDDRYATADEMLRAIDAISVPVAELPDAKVRATRRRKRTRRIAASLGVATAVAGIYLLARAATGGPGAPPVIDEGEWRGETGPGWEPSSWHGRIHKLDDRHYRVTWTNGAWTEPPSTGTARNEGVFELRYDDHAWRLAGDTQDVAGWCCSRFGHVEYEVGGPDRLHQVVAYWGDQPGHYVQSFGPWWFERVGPLP